MPTHTVSAFVRSTAAQSGPGAAVSTRVQDGGDRLRICLISETMITGVGRHLTDVARAMAARGHEVHLLHSIDRAERPLLAELAGLPRIKTYALPIQRAPHWSDVAVLVALGRYLWRQGPFDVIHGHSSKGGFHARLLGLGFGRLCLYTPHCFATLQPLSPVRRALYAAVERVLGHVSDVVICLTSEERQHGAELGIPGPRLQVIPNGLDGFDTSLGQDLRRGLGLPEDAVVVGFIGRMDYQKSPQRLVEASRLVLARCPNVHFVMVGDGPLRAGLEARVREIGCADHFSWCGNVPGRTWMSGFDILAMPSVYEGFSYVLMEALYAGVPVVCTPVSGVGDLLADGVQGFIVPHDDPARLADRLEHLARNPALRAAMGEGGRQRAAMFSLDRMTTRLEAVYRSSRGPRVAEGVACSGA